MEYKRPEGIKTLHPDELAKLKDSLASELRLVETLLEGQIESVCDMCERFGYGYEALPEGWGWLYDIPYLLCDKCIGKWSERFGAPKVHREGDIIDDDSSIPEDSTHRGQAALNLI